MNDLCVLSHDDERRALPGLRICNSHRDALERDLANLPGLHDELGDALGNTGSGGGAGRVSGTAEARLPINPAVADWRDQIKHDLAWWAIYVADQRGIGLPDDEVPAIAAWLGKHVEWIAGHTVAAEECPPVIRGLAARARNLLDPNRRLATGERCRLDAGGERCAGTIAMVQAPDETWTARCTVCGTQEAEPYLHDRLAGRLVTIERVRAYALRAHGVRVERATIRSWAARERVHTTITDGVTWYDLGSVQRYLSERRRMAG